MEHCQICKREYAVVWNSPRDLWRTLIGHDGGLRCIDCFDGFARQMGFHLRWVPLPLENPHRELCESGEHHYGCYDDPVTCDWCGAPR